MMQQMNWMGANPWMLFIAILIVVPFWQICRKAGYSGWLALLIIVPMVNLAFIYFLAFAPWPNQARRNQNP